MMINLPEIVRNWRTEKGLTQAAAADLVGISQPSFSRIESGASIPDRESARAFVAAGVFTAEQLGRAIVAPATSEAA
jgi:transcriptional regulator with XRE-family HTH domain